MHWCLGMSRPKRLASTAGSSQPRELRELRPETPAAVAVKLADPQRFVLEAFEAEGLTLAVIAQTLLEEMKNKKSQHRIDAARLALDATVGRAPASGVQKHMHLHGKTDRFFDETRFANAPAPILTGDD